MKQLVSVVLGSRVRVRAAAAVSEVAKAATAATARKVRSLTKTIYPAALDAVLATLLTTKPSALREMHWQTEERATRATTRHRLVRQWLDAASSAFVKKGRMERDGVDIGYGFGKSLFVIVASAVVVGVVPTLPSD